MPVICYPIFGPKVQTYHMALSVSVKNITKNKLNISLYYVAVYSWKEKLLFGIDQSVYSNIRICELDPKQ